MNTTDQPVLNSPVIEPFSVNVSDVTFTGFLVILIFAIFFKALPTLWQFNQELIAKKELLISQMIQWQLKTSEHLENAIASLRDLHNDEMDLLKDIRNSINHKDK